MKPTTDDMCVDLEKRLQILERARKRAQGMEKVQASIAAEQAAIRRALWAEERLKRLGPSRN
jgi:hypothetical protein